MEKTVVITILAEQVLLGDLPGTIRNANEVHLHIMNEPITMDQASDMLSFGVKQRAKAFGEAPTVPGDKSMIERQARYQRRYPGVATEMVRYGKGPMFCRIDVEGTLQKHNMTIQEFLKRRTTDKSYRAAGSLWLRLYMAIIAHEKNRKAGKVLKKIA